MNAYVLGTLIGTIGGIGWIVLIGMIWGSRQLLPILVNKLESIRPRDAADMYNLAKRYDKKRTKKLDKEFSELYSMFRRAARKGSRYIMVEKKLLNKEKIAVLKKRGYYVASSEGYFEETEDAFYRVSWY